MTDVRIIQGNVLKVGDTAPPMRVMLLNENGESVDLTGVNAQLRLKAPYADSAKVDETLAVHDAEHGIVEYDWTASDTDEESLYQAEVTTTDGSDTISYPNDHYFRVHIMEDL